MLQDSLVEHTDLPLINRVAATGKSLIISTDMASIAELDVTVRVAQRPVVKTLSCLSAPILTLGKRLKQDVKRGTGLIWKLI